MRLFFSDFIRWRGFRVVAVLAGLCALGETGLTAQAPLLEDQVLVPEERERLALQWRIDAAERALSAGLPRIAEELYRGILAEPALGERDRAELSVRLAASLIAQRRFQTAHRVLETVVPSRRTDAYYLYRAVLAYGNGRKVEGKVLSEALARVSPEALSLEDRPWYHLLRGIEAEIGRAPERVEAAFRQARATAVSATQRSFFDSLILREKLLRSPADEALAAEIRGKREELSGRAGAYPFAREYAIILNNLGRQEEALAVIEEERENRTAAYTSRQRDQLLLLKGLILGADSEEGRLTLRQLVRNGRDRDAMGVALQLLARNAGSGAAFGEFLNQMISRSEPHPLLGQMYYLRSQMALADKRPEAIALAEADARLLLERFPGLDQITNVYRLLAYAALQRIPAQYRSAADFLIQLRDQTADPMERKELNRLIGDCYFLNGDYANAVDFYQAAKDRALGVGQDGELFLRLITAEVRAGKIDSALFHIDEADFSGVIGVDDRWRAEWNVAQALQAAGDLELALERVRLLLGRSGAGSVPAALDLRLRWLEARLSLVAGEVEGVGERVDNLIARVDALPSGMLEERVVRLLKTEMLLLKADILIESGEASAGIEVLEQLRTGFASSSAAERSYLTEANYFGSIDDFQSAQATLQRLATTYPESRLAAQALFEAALYCERRGAEHYAEAVRIHNNLAERYPEDRLVYTARLKQGDLLRQMNDFAGAQIIYENLINRFPEHPRRYMAELSRADCMLALAKDNTAQLREVALVLERLIDTPNLPVDFQAEIGYKLGFALARRGAEADAREVFALLTSRFVLEGERITELGPTGTYWISRILLDLGSLLEKAENPGEALEIYRRLMAHNLPGQSLAQSRVERLQALQ